MVSTDLTVARRRCGRKAKGHGGPCQRWAMHGQTVCHLHGGKSPQALRKADERMRELVHPAIDALKRMIDANEFPAARYVLDWAGFKPADRVEGTGEVTIRIVHEDQPIIALDVPYASRNGHSDSDG